MESLLPPNNVGTGFQSMTPFSAHFRSSFKLLSSVPLTSLTHSVHSSPSPSPSPSPSISPSPSCSAKAIVETQPLPVSKRVYRKEVLSQAELKKNWLESLSFLSLPKTDVAECCLSSNTDAASAWVIGVDPDVSGALAVLKPDLSVHVFDSPHLKVPVGKRLRKRLDARSIVQLIQSFDAPKGTTAYIEQSHPFPKDGKQGWWSGGFGYGLWIGSFVASGYSVVPVSSLAWKNEYKLAGSNSTKDDSRRLASCIFPSMNALLKRKKDHGRAEALLIAAYGKGLKLSCSSASHLVDDLSL